MHAPVWWPFVQPELMSRRLVQGLSGLRRGLAQIQPLPSGSSRAELTVNKTLWAVGHHEFETLAELVNVAREKLRPLAESQSRTEKYRTIVALGGTDGAGANIRLASIDLNNDGTLSEAEYVRFMSEAESLLANVQSSVQSSSVTLALVLTIAVGFALADIQPPFHDGEEHGIFGPVGSGYLTGTDDATRIAHVFYAIEVSLIGVSILTCSAGLMGSIVLFNILASMPSKLSAITFILENAPCYARVQQCWFAGILSLGLATPFICARYSMLACLVIGMCYVFFLVSVLAIVRGPRRWETEFLSKQATVILAQSAALNKHRSPHRSTQSEGGQSCRCDPNDVAAMSTVHAVPHQAAHVDSA